MGNRNSIRKSKAQHDDYWKEPPTKTMSDKEEVRLTNFDLDALKHGYDPLGDVYHSLCEAGLICALSIPKGIVSAILACVEYREDTLEDQPIYKQTLTSSPTKDYSECALLINPPKSTALNYYLRQIQYKCGFFEWRERTEWPEDAEVYFQLELFDGTNHRDKHCEDKSDYNVVWRSERIECGKSVQVVELKNLNVRLQPNQTYLFWVEVLRQPFHAYYTRYDPSYGCTMETYPISKQLKHAFVREVKLCDNKWFTRNVSKMWHFSFNAIVPS